MLIKNSSKQADPSDFKDSFDINDIDFDINGLDDQLLLGVDEQINLHCMIRL